MVKKVTTKIQDNSPSQKPQALTARSHYSVSYSRITAGDVIIYGVGHI